MFIPALLTKTSRPPNCDETFSTNSSIFECSEISNFKTFRLEEINSLGKWSNNHVNLFIYQQYDFLIYPDLNLIPEMENILINSYSKCRIGFFNTNLNLFEMILKSELEYDINYRMNKLYKYLKKLK